MLIDLLTDVMEQLDDKRAAVNIISIDFEKAFNRMHHLVCLNALALKGASNQTLMVVSSFCLLYTSPSPRDRQKSRMPSSA